MPGRSGWQFLQDLAAYEKVAGTPVVIVTSQALSAEARAVLERSARAIVMKSDLSEERVRRVITEVIPERFGQAADRAQQE